MIDPKLELTLVQTLDDANELMRWLGERRRFLGVDTETGGLRWWEQPLRLVQFGDTRRAFALPAAEWGGVIKQVLHEYEGDLVMHNAKFDGHFLERTYGLELPWHRVHDTRIAAHIVDPASSTALKILATRYIDKRAAHGQDLLKRAMHDGKWTWETVPIDLEAYWAYGALDATLTVHLAEELIDRVQHDDNLRQVYDLELACQRVVARMEERGVRCDLEHVERKRDEFRTYCLKARDWVSKKYSINLGSNRQVAERLVDEGVPLTQRTPTGQLALDADILKRIDHELAHMVLTVRRLEKLTATYFDAFHTFADENAYLHANVNVLGARTGRMSVTDPPLQTLPRDSEENPASVEVRNAFVPSEGRQLILADFDQIEQRLVAHFAQDEGMAEAFATGEDFFTNIARQLYEDDTIMKRDPRRQVTKNAMYAKSYGAGAAKIALTAGIDEAYARSFLDRYDVVFPGVRRFQQRVGELAHERATGGAQAYVTSPLGRRHIADRGKEYKLVNYLIQGTAADVLKRKLVDLDLVGLGEYMVLPVHDEVVFDVPKEDVEEAVVTIESTMTEMQFMVPLTVGVTVVDRWGAKYA